MKKNGSKKETRTVTLTNEIWERMEKYKDMTYLADESVNSALGFYLDRRDDAEASKCLLEIEEEVKKNGK